MEELIEKLLINQQAIEALDHRYHDTAFTSVYWNEFATQEQKITELLWITKVKKRVLRMRQTLLENIQLETSKQLNRISQDLRKENLKQVA